MNLLRMADTAWNARGRDTAAFAYAYCVTQRYSSAAAASLVLHALSDGWELAHRLWVRIYEGEFLDRLAAPLRRDFVDATYVTDVLEARDLPALRGMSEHLAVIHACSRECRLDELADPVRICRLRLEVLLHVMSAAWIRGRYMWPDPEKGTRPDWGAQILDHLRGALEALEKSMEQPLRVKTEDVSSQAASADDSALVEKLKTAMKRYEEETAEGKIEC